MTPPLRQPILLSSFRASSKYRQSIDRDEAAAFLNGYLALWHPLSAAISSGPPTIGSHYEYDHPQGNTIFAVPEVPAGHQPGDWAARMEEAGSLTFKSSPDWQETLNGLAGALKQDAAELGREEWMPFAGLGLGYLVFEAFCDAQDHVNPLGTAIFYDQVRQAAQSKDEQTRRDALGQAAHLLHEAREVVYPSQLYQALSLVMDSPRSDGCLNRWLETDLEFSLIGSTAQLEAWAKANPELVEKLRERVQTGTIDWWGGPAFDQEDAVLPTAAWLTNLSQGLGRAKELVGQVVQSHGRRRFGAGPTLPTFLSAMGLKRSLGYGFDGGTWPHMTTGISAWRGPDGKLVETVNRKPDRVDEPATWFHLGNTLYEGTTSEYVGWVHFGMTEQGAGDAIGYFLKSWIALHQLAPVFGQISTLEKTIREIPATEQFNPPGADDFQSDYLLDQTGQGFLAHATANPISRFAEAARQWRRWECARTIHALWSTLSSDQSEIGRLGETISVKADELLKRWNEPASPVVEVKDTLDEVAHGLAHRLLGKSAGNSPGILIFNPCSFERKIPVVLPEAQTLLPAPAWASQAMERGIAGVIEVPPLGFAWVPRAIEKGTKVRMPKQNIVEGHTLRNEYVQVEVDPQTGGIRSIRDARRQIPRLGQQLVFGPGSLMKCQEVRITKQGHALGEITSIGALVDVHEHVLAQYQQTVRLWAGRKLVEVDIQLEPTPPIKGYPWHAYFGSRWAWRDPGTLMNKAVNWTKLPTHQTRPETSGFLELEMPAGRCTIFSGGLPFWQRHGTRMVDTLLCVEGETASQFHLAVALDDELPQITCQDWLTSALVVPVDRGPPAAGVSSWLFHLDAPSVMLLDLSVDAAQSRSIVARMVETFGYATEAQLRCPKNPVAAQTQDTLGQQLMVRRVEEDAVFLHVGCYELQHLKIDFA